MSLLGLVQCGGGLKDPTGRPCSDLQDHRSVVGLRVHLQLTDDVRTSSWGSAGGGGGEGGGEGLMELTSVHLQGRKLPVHSRSAIIKSLVISMRPQFTSSLSDCELPVDN